MRYFFRLRIIYSYTSLHSEILSTCFVRRVLIVNLNSIGRLIVTKRQDRDDDIDDEYEDITNLYKKKDG